MKLKVYVSDKKRKELIAQGIECKSSIILNVDLQKMKDSDRILLSHYIYKGSYNDDFDYYLSNYKSSSSNHLDCYTIEEVLQYLKADEKQQLKKEAEEKKISEKKSKIDNLLKNYVMDDVNIYRFESKYAYIVYKDYKHEEKFESIDVMLKFVSNNNKMKQLINETVQNVEKIEKGKIENAKKEAEKKAKIEKEKEELLTWAKENGSELLKMRIKHNQNWFEIAIDEKIMTYAPNGFNIPDNFKYEDWWIVKNATFEQLKELETIKLPENSNNDLCICRYKIKDEENYEFYHRTFIEFSVTIAGEKRYLIKEIQDSDED